MLLTWLRTVFSEIFSLYAICLLASPVASSFRISSSRVEFWSSWISS